MQVRAALRAVADRLPDPSLAEAPLRRGPAGWDNVHWRLGDDWALRLPRRELARHLVEHEAAWLPGIAPRLPVAVPVPALLGPPHGAVTTAWTLVPWLAGDRWDAGWPPTPEQVEDLAGVLVRLHVPAPTDAPVNRYRGVSLHEREAATWDRVAELRRWVGQGRQQPFVDEAGIDRVVAAWETGLAATEHAGPLVWCHGDLHPGNLLVDDGRLTAVVDWGDVCGGDPATDLAARWWCVPAEHDARFVAALPEVGEATWDRARAWAASITLFLVGQAPRAQDDALLSIARRTWRRLLAEG